MEAVGHDSTEAGLKAAEALRHADDAAKDLAEGVLAAREAVSALARGDVELGVAEAAVTKASDLLAAAQWRLRDALESARNAGVESAVAAARAADADRGLGEAAADAAAGTRLLVDAQDDAIARKVEEAGAAGTASKADKALAAASALAAAAAKALAAANAQAAAWSTALSAALSKAAANAIAIAIANSTATNATKQLGNAANAATGFWQRWGNVIHWVVAGGIEFLATAVPAMIAFGGAMLVGVQGAQMLQQHLTALWTAAEATGNVFHQTMGTMLGMKSVLQQAQDAANPHIFALLGAGIGIVKEQAGGLVQAGSQVILVFDRFAARLQYDFSKAGGAGQTMGALLHAMVPDLVEFGQVFGNIGHAIANFASKMPGLAEVLLKLLDAASRVVLWVSKLPTPLIMTAMAMEEMWRWGQPLVAILTKLPVLLAGFVSSGFGVVPVAARIAEVFRALVAFGPVLVANLAGVIGSLAPAGSAFGNAANAVSAFSFKLASAIQQMTIWQALAGTALIGVIVGVGIALDRTRSSTQQFTDSFNKMLATAKNVNVMTYIATDFQTATDRINQQTAVLNRYSGAVDYVASTNAKWTSQLRNMEGPLAGAGQGAQNLNDKISILAGKALAAIPGMEGLGHAYAGLFTAEHAASAVQQLTAVEQQQVNAMKNVSSGMGYLEEHYHLTAQGALALADAAGVKLASGLTGATTAAIINRDMIAQLVHGYEAMGQPASEVGTDMSALAIQSGLAASNVSQLNQAWDQFMQNLTGGTSGLAGFEISLSNMGKVTASAGQNLAKYTGSMNSSVSQFAASLQSFTGKGAAAWQQFDQVVGSTGPQLIDWLRTAGQEGALGADAQEKFTQAVRDMSAQMVPFASKSSIAESHLMGMASAADQNITKWPAFLKWIKEGHDTIGGLSSIIGDASKNMENMGQVGQNLGNVMNNDLTKMMDAVKLKAYGVQGAFQALGNQLSQMHPDSAKVASTFQTLVSTLSRVFGPQQARQLVTTFVHQFGDTIKNGMIVPENNARDAGNKTSQNLGDGLTAGKGHVTSAVQGIVQNINSILHPLPGQVQETGAKASQGMHAGLQSGSPGIQHWPLAVNDWISQGLDSLPGTLEHLGAMGVSGFVHGIESMDGAVQAAANHLGALAAGALAGFLRVGSPSKVTMKIGADTAEGLAIGMTDGFPAVQKAAELLGGIIPGGVMRGGGGGTGPNLGDVMQKIGHDTILKLVRGLTGTIPQIKAAIKDITDTVDKALTAGMTGWERSKFHELGSWADPIVGLIGQDNRRLQVLANERDKIMKQIKAAEQYTKSVTSNLISSTGLSNITLPSGDTGKGYAKNVLTKLGIPAGEITQIITEYSRALQDLGTATTTPAKAEQIFAGILTQIGLNATQAAAAMKAFKSALSGESSINTGQTPIVSIQQQMDTQLKQLQAFDHNIDVLKKMHLNKTLLNQIIQAGYQQGGALAQALAHGSASQIQSLNKTEEAIIKASKKIGKDSANAMFDTGKNAGKGFLSGLKSEEKQIEKEMEKIAKTMIDAIKKALGIKSPSTVMHDQGMQAAQGLAKGLLDGEPIVLAAAKKLATAVSQVKVAPPKTVGPLQPGGPVIQIGTGTPPGGIAQPMVVVHQHIAGSVLSEQQLQQYVQSAQLKYTHRNNGNGLYLPGRGFGTPVSR